jgi:HlyD family secretion protein
MKSNKLWIIITVIAVLAGVGYFYRATLLSLINPRATAAAKAAADLESKTVAVRPATDLTTVSAAGNIALASEEAAMFEVEGVIDEVFVEIGDKVAAGDLLATLKTTDLERAVERADLALQVKKNALDKLMEPATDAEIAAARAQLVSAQEKLADLKAGPKATELAAAQAALAAAQASYADLQAGSSQAELTQAAANFNKAAIAVKDAQQDYDRIAYSDSIGQSQQAIALQQATIDYDVAKAGYEIATEPASEADLQNGIKTIKQAQNDLDNLQTTQADLASAEAEVANAESNLTNLLDGPTEPEITDAKLAIDQAQIDLQEAENDLSNARLRAPLDGTITTIQATAGEKVTTDISGAIYIADLTQMELTVNVSEVDVSKVYVGQPAKVVLDAFPDQTFSGQVSRIAPTSTATSGVVNYEVAVRLDNLNLDGVRAGMTAVATIADDLTTQQWLVPTSAMQEFEGKTTVTVVRDGKPDQVEVKPGISQGEWTTVESPDLKETDKVVGEVATFVKQDQSNQRSGPFGGGPPPR